MTWKPPLLDAVIAAAFVAMVVAEAVVSTVPDNPALYLGVGGLGMAAVAWRRRAPLVVTALTVVVNLAVNAGGDLTPLLAMVLVAFTVGYECSPPRSYVGLALMVVPFVLASIVDELEPSDLAAATVFFVGPWAVGVLLSGRVASAELAVARAAQLEQEREFEAARAAAEERTRIARELHDIVSHSISVVTIQTQAVRRRLGPDHAREADDLAAVEATAREALAEMRRLFGVLRTEGESPDLAPQPGLGELPRLVQQLDGGAMRVRLSVEGEQVPLSPGIDLAAYRIAQEGLTNALRHADATEARVLVRYSADRLDVVVEDDGRGIDGASTDGGHGLTGIRERVALYGGALDLGRSEAGGVRLAATLPVREAAP